MRGTIGKFIFRFRLVEEEMAVRGKRLQDATLKEMDELWEEVKKRGGPGDRRRK